MRRHKTAKPQRPNALKRRNAPKLTRHRKSLATDVSERIALLTRGRDEALEQQTATAEVLKIISSSPSDLKPVFDTILANATRLCEGNLASLWRYDGEFLVGAAQYNASPAFVEHYMRTKLKPEPSGPARLAAFERRTVHVADITAEPGFTPIVLQYEQARTVLAVPLLRDEDLIGVVAIWRREVNPFTDQQIALVRTFADQAVIAIENARLLNELRESLQQQTATADALKVISSSPGDLEPVFLAMLEKARQFAKPGMASCFSTKMGFSALLHCAACPRPWRRSASATLSPSPGTGVGRVLRTKKTVHISDVLTEPEYLNIPVEVDTKPGEFTEIRIVLLRTPAFV